MASHDYHPDTHEHGLADGCARCDELATRPLELDDENFHNAWERMLRTEFGPFGERDHYRSGNEAKLCGLLYTWAVFMQRYTPLDPRALPETWVAA